MTDLNATKVAENLTLAVQYCYEGDVAGDVAEFGTCGGVTAEVLARAMKCHGRHEWAPKKTLHLFDSFEGLPSPESGPDKNSPHVQKGWWKAGTCRCPIGEVELCRLASQYLPAGQVVVHGGWFKDTLLLLPDTTYFSLLHIDCDLYQSAKDVLDHVFGNGLLSPGGVIVFDDYNCNRASYECGERRAWDEAVTHFFVRHEDFSRAGWASRSFIVHGYKGAK